MFRTFGRQGPLRACRVEGEEVLLKANRTYCLRKGVRLQNSGTHCFLVSRFPLQATKLDASWKPFFHQMDDGRPRAIHQLNRRPSGVSDVALERFLNGLARKGFLTSVQTPSGASLAAVSVIIPVRNRPRDLKRCLDSLEELDYPREKLEIIVVDDASADRTPQVAAQYPVHLIRNTLNRGASYSRNRGARHASGDILCFLDSDCHVPVQWLRELTTIFNDPRVAAGGGMVTSAMDKRPLDRYEKVQSSLHMGHRGRDSHGGDAFFYLPSCNLAVRRAVFARMGGFNEEMVVGEDVDLCWRLVDSGGVIVYRPTALVFHRHRNRLWSFCRRRYDYGTSEPLLQSLHRRRRKKFPLWPQPTLFWLLMAAAALLHPALAPFALLLLLTDSAQRRRRAARMGLQLSYPTVLQAKCRQYASVLYHMAAFGSRYYLLVALMLSVFGGGWISTVILVGHVVVGLVQYKIKRPDLDPLSFFLFFSLEQISYQTGVWTGCMVHRLFSPVAPRPCLRRKAVI